MRKKARAEASPGQILEKAKDRGVPERYRDVYRQFLNSHEPYDLRAELALQRTLVVEARDCLEQQTERRRKELCQAVRDSLRKRLSRQGDSEKLSRLLDLVEEVVDQEVSITFPSFLTMQHYKDLSFLLRQVVETAEKMKKIQEGVKLDISLDTDTLIAWLKFVVFPFVTDPAVRAQMVQRAATFKLRGAEDVVDVEAEGEEPEEPPPARHPGLGSLSLPVPARMLDTLPEEVKWSAG